MAQRRYTSQFLYQFEAMPVLLSCNFIVDSTNGNGFGVRSLKGSGIKRVYMHTTATPAAGNPNPAAGHIMVQFTDTYARYLSGFDGFVEPTTGSNVSISAGLTQGLAYTIVSVGTSTQANWAAVGLPPGVAPSVGLPFIASTATPGTGTGVVQLSNTVGLAIEPVGDISQAVAALATYPAGTAQPIGQNVGGYAILKIVGPTSSSVTTPIAVAPANGTVVGLNFYLSNSSVTLSGQ